MATKITKKAKGHDEGDRINQGDRKEEGLPLYILKTAWPKMLGQLVVMGTDQDGREVVLRLAEPKIVMAAATHRAKGGRDFSTLIDHSPPSLVQLR